MNTVTEISDTASPAEFRLRKYYADCVSEAGDVLIAYYGYAMWNGLTLHYSSLLTRVGNEASHAQHSIRKSEEPSSAGSGVHWRSRNLTFEGTWDAIDPAYSEVLFFSPEGTVEWQCLQPRAKAEIRWGHQQLLHGLGYVERLDMTIAPWKLPIEQLFWGRFLSDSDSLVWIDWRGPHHRRVLLHNGRRIANGKITDHEISVGSAAKLTFRDRAVLREGTLGTVALAALSAFKQSLPGRLLNVEERKWRSRAHWNECERSDGWAIHEVVKWPP